jgi:cystathionine beta-lyase
LGGANFTPMAVLSPEIADRTITLVSPSKTFNVAGLYCAFAIIPNPDLCQAYRQELDRTSMHLSSPGLAAAQVAFSGECDAWLAELLPYLTANRDALVAYVHQNLPGVGYFLPDATYLAWLDFNELIKNGKMPASPYKFFLKEARLALNDGETFGPGGNGFVRLNFGCPRTTLMTALERMKTALDAN